MKKSKLAIGLSSLMVAGVLTSGCTNSINEDASLVLDKKDYSLDEAKGLKITTAQGESNVTNGILKEVYNTYYKDELKKKDLDKQVEAYVKALEGQNGGKKISKNEKEKIKDTYILGYGTQEAYDDLIKVDKEAISKEAKEGYTIVNTVYIAENDAKGASKGVAKVKKALEGISDDKKIEKIVNKYSGKSEYTIGKIDITKDISSYDEETTKKVLKSKGKEFIDVKGTNVTVYVVNKYNGDESQVLEYKKEKVKRQKLNNGYEILKALDKKYDSFKIGKDLGKYLDEENGITSPDKDTQKGSEKEESGTKK